MISCKKTCAAITLAAAVRGGAIAHAGPTLYAADNLTNGVLQGVVELDSGTLAQSGSFVTSGTISGLTTDGAGVFVSLPDGISKYDSSGTVDNSYPNVGIDSFGALAVSAGTLFAADNLTNGVLSGVVEFDSASLFTTGSFVTSSHIAGLATNGADIFASLPDGISEYDLSGDLLGSYANVGIDSFGALSFSHGVLYAADNLTNGVLSGVVLLDGSLTEVGSFVTSGAIAGIASDGTTVYASLPDGIVEYDTAGEVIGKYANVGIDHFEALALAPSTPSVPEPATWMIMLAGFALTGAAIRRRTAATATAS